MNVTGYTVSEIGGFTLMDVFEYEFKRINSASGLYDPPGVFPRQNVRLRAGAIVGSDDLNHLRLELVKSTPDCVK